MDRLYSLAEHVDKNNSTMQQVTPLGVGTLGPRDAFLPGGTYINVGDEEVGVGVGVGVCVGVDVDVLVYYMYPRCAPEWGDRSLRSALASMSQS